MLHQKQDEDSENEEADDRLDPLNTSTRGKSKCLI